MKLAGRIPVEPLDEERLTNIERRVVAGAVDAAARGGGSRARRRQLGRLLAAAAIVAAGVVGWALRGPDPRPPGVAASAPIRVQTELQRSAIDLGDARIDSDPATAFEVTRPEGGVLVVLARGKLELEVARRGARPPLIVRAGDTDVIVVGTHFTVDYGDGRGEVDVRVTEGVVRVSQRQQEVRVAAGQGWRTRTGLVAITDRGPAAAEATRTGATGDERGVARTADPALAVGPVPDVLHGRTPAVPEVSGGTAAAVREAPGGAAASNNPTPTAAPAAKPPGGVAPNRVRARASDPLIELRTAIRAQRVEPALDLGESSAARAVVKYYDIAAHRSGEQASQAFYSIAVVDHLRLARNADALQTLEAYIRRFPGGKEYRAVLWLRVRILCLDKVDDHCRAAAYTYLHEAPGDAAAQLAERLTLTE